MRDRFEFLKEGEFFRFPKYSALYRKIPLRYESTMETNCQSLNNTFHFLNGIHIVIPVLENDSIPSKKQLENE